MDLKKNLKKNIDDSNLSHLRQIEILSELFEEELSQITTQHNLEKDHLRDILENLEEFIHQLEEDELNI